MAQSQVTVTATSPKVHQIETFSMTTMEAIDSFGSVQNSWAAQQNFQ
jgi:hypothetical protein